MHVWGSHHTGSFLLQHRCIVPLTFRGSKFSRENGSSGTAVLRREDFDVGSDQHQNPITICPDFLGLHCISWYPLPSSHALGVFVLFLLHFHPPLPSNSPFSLWSPSLRLPLWLLRNGITTAHHCLNFVSPLSRPSFSICATLHYPLLNLALLLPSTPSAAEPLLCCIFRIPCRKARRSCGWSWYIGVNMIMHFLLFILYQWRV